MNSRLLQFLNAENISQSQFADSIGVARASVSHILAGRNKPGFDFIERMARRYPTLNLDWLITGKGKMYAAGTQAAFSAPAKAEAEEPLAMELWPDEEEKPAVAEPAATTERKTLVRQVQHAVKQRSISRIVIFYDDNTFQELK